MQTWTISDPDGFAQLRQEWSRLAALARPNDPFIGHERLTRWMATFGKGSTLHVMACRDSSGELLGILPTYLRSQGTKVRVRALRLLGDEGVGAVGLAAFARPDAEEAVLSEFEQRLRRGGAWDIVDFNYVDASRSFFERLMELPRTRIIAESDYSPRIPLPNDFDAYLASLSQNARHNIRRTLRRIEDRGLELERIDAASDLSEAHRDLMRLQDCRLREKFGEGYSLPAAYRDFSFGTLEDQLREGSLRLLFYRLGERRVAAFHGFRCGDVMYADRTGFDDDGGAPNVLRPLWASAIRLAIDEGCSALDMLNGNYAYKSDWGATDVRSLSRVFSYALTPAGTARRLADAAMRGR